MAGHRGGMRPLADRDGDGVVGCSGLRKEAVTRASEAGEAGERGG